MKFCSRSISLKPKRRSLLRRPEGHETFPNRAHSFPTSNKSAGALAQSCVSTPRMQLVHYHCVAYVRLVSVVSAAQCCMHSTGPKTGDPSAASSFASHSPNLYWMGTRSGESDDTQSTSAMWTSDSLMRLSSQNFRKGGAEKTRPLTTSK